MKRKRIFSLVLALFTILTLSGCGKRTEYIENLNNFKDAVQISGIKSEDLAQLVQSVWQNSINEISDPATNKYTIKPGRYSEEKQVYYGKEDVGKHFGDFLGSSLFVDFNEDFNTSLAALFADSEIIKTTNEIKAEREEIGELLKQLKQPPKGLEDCYEIADDLYDAYYKVSELALAPSGTLIDYTSAFSSEDKTLVAKYEKLELLIPEK